MKININETVTVVLTDAGDKIWRNGRNFNIGYYDPNTKILKEQLWVIMNVFGPEIWAGGTLLFLNNDIEINATN